MVVKWQKLEILANKLTGKDGAVVSIEKDGINAVERKTLRLREKNKSGNRICLGRAKKQQTTISIGVAYRSLLWLHPRDLCKSESGGKSSSLLTMTPNKTTLKQTKSFNIFVKRKEELRSI